MCYEVFNRSAADAYMRSIRRERLQAERQNASSSPILQPVINEISGVAKSLDWNGMAGWIIKILNQYRKSFGVAAVLIGVIIFFSFLSSPVVQFTAFGNHLRYNFKDREKVKYLVGLQTNVKMWSEHQGRLDTPMDQFQIDNIGNVFIQKNPNSKDRALITIKPWEWIEIVRRGEHTESRNIPLNHPSLATISVLMDNHGTLMKRYYQFSPRLSKSLDFLMPSFPRGIVHKNWIWTEPVQWLESIGDWKIVWTGQLHWTVVGQADCSDNTCDELDYKADLKPRLVGGPAWASGAIRGISFKGTASGEALFDSRHGRLFSNSFHYDGVLRMPISDLGRIPWELRIGRGVIGSGELVLDFKSRIDIHQP